jgi:urea transport system ATP-binding protein
MTAAVETILYLDGVTVSFDGFKALDGLSFYVLAGELRAVIGPNGAGKTTMMDVVTGRTRPDSGTVQFNGGIDLTRLDEAAIANLGVGRKFQRPTVFENHTVFDNLELAGKGRRRVAHALLGRTSRQTLERIEEMLATIALRERRDALAGDLSHGQKQWLEIGMLLMQDPELLLIDEPAAGMTDEETAQTSALLKRLAATRSVVVVEHDMEFVRSLESRVTVLHEGSVLAEGSMDRVQNDPRVVEVYLGR